MKTREIPGKQTILLVDGLPELPNGNTYIPISIRNGHLYVKYSWDIDNEYVFDIVTKRGTDWKFISTIEELTHEDADELFESDPPESSIQTFYFHLGKNKVAIDPIQQSEYDVFNPSTTLIFVKEK